MQGALLRSGHASGKYQVYPQNISFWVFLYFVLKVQLLGLWGLPESCCWEIFETGLEGNFSFLGQRWSLFAAHVISCKMMLLHASWLHNNTIQWRKAVVMVACTGWHCHLWPGPGSAAPLHPCKHPRALVVAVVISSGTELRGKFQSRWTWRLWDRFCFCSVFCLSFTCSAIAVDAVDHAVSREC